MPPLRSATGQVFMAFLPRRIADAHLQQSAGYPDAPFDRKEIDRVLIDIRAVGYASVDQMFIPGLYALSAPVLNWQGEIEAAITLISRESGLIDPEGQRLAALKAFTSTTNSPAP